MHIPKLLPCALLATAFLSLPMQAQDSLEVTAKTIQEHIDHKTFPSYPPLAKAAHIQGTVLFDLRIGTNGRIESMNVVSGPAILQQEAMDCFKQWTFHPFLKDGVPVAAHGRYSIIFLLGSSPAPSTQTPAQVSTSTPGAPNQTVVVHVKAETPVQTDDPELEKQFQDADSQCKEGVLAKTLNEVTSQACAHAATLAERLPMDGNYIAKRSAFVYAATAFANIRALQDALMWASKAVDTVKLGQDGDSGSSAAYSTKGTIEGMLGDLNAADADLTTAESFSRKGIAWVEKEAPSLRQQYVLPFVRNLRFHAQVLQALGRSTEAQQKLDEANKLQ